VLINTAISWNVTLFRLVDGYQGFIRTHDIQL